MRNVDEAEQEKGDRELKGVGESTADCCVLVSDGWTRALSVWRHCGDGTRMRLRYREERVKASMVLKIMQSSMVCTQTQLRRGRKTM